MTADQWAIPEEVEVHLDKRWCSEPELRIEEPLAVEHFANEVGFCSMLKDSRRPGRLRNRSMWTLRSTPAAECPKGS